jgi:starch-binding outer membrane protein, SusD/RagB family
MRKNRLYIIIAALLTFGSCGEEYLDTESYTELNELTFYKTPKDAYNALVGVYDGFQRMYGQGWSMPVTSELLSDNVFGGGGSADGYGGQLIDEFDIMRSPGDIKIFDDNWKDYYKGIFRCNSLIGNLEESGINWGENEALKNQYVAEARFIRAVAYFDLVRLFEKVVLLDKPSPENLPQANPDDVYKLIAEDLTFAVANLPAVSYAQQSASDHGRVTKWAAEAMLARVFLFYTGYYDKADLAGVTKQQVLDNLEDLIQNSGHALVSDFANLWPAASLANYAGERNPENIFNIKATYTSSYNGDMDGNHWMVMLGLRDGNYPPYGQGWGFATVNPNLWNDFANTDTRKVASIIDVEDEVDGFNPAGTREYTGYYNKKYTPMSSMVLNEDTGLLEPRSLAQQQGGVNFMIGQYQDFVMIRYADVLLMAAELGSANAQAYFDLVRQRAYKADFTSIPVTQENIMNERKLEFAFEGIRYWDLLRQGVDVAASVIAQSVEVKSGGVTETKTIKAENIIKTRGFQQIPNTQITLSGGTLVQNEGW